jgi:hypothetical protein
MSHGEPGETPCVGCGIPLSDGYTVGCRKCDNRRASRLRRGETTSPTGFPGELIDNTHPKGKLILA